MNALHLTDYEREALKHLVRYPLTSAIFQRRSRRFLRGGEVPDGTLKYKSRFKPEPLSELERLLLVTTVAGKTGWQKSVTRHDRYIEEFKDIVDVENPYPLSFRWSRDLLGRHGTLLRGRRRAQPMGAIGGGPRDQLARQLMMNYSVLSCAACAFLLHLRSK